MGTDGSPAANDGMDANVGNLTVNLAGTAPAGTKATINIESQGDLADGATGDFNNVGTVSAVAGSTINITGEGNLDLNGLANNATIDASAATGNLVLEGSNFANGVAFKSGADTITLGAGADTVQFSSGAASGVANTTTPATTALGLQVDVVNGFTAGNGGDVFDFTGVAGDSDYTALTAAVQAQIDALSGATATLQNAADIAADIATADEWTAFTFQGQTYAQYDSDGNGDFDAASDLLVQITGVSVADLNDTNFA
jgi:hypothetical protein